MKNFLRNISKGILYFFGGVFFTLFIFTVFIAVYLFNENTRLQKELNRLKTRVDDTTIQTEVKRIIPNKIIEEEPEPEIQHVPVRRGIGWENWNNLKKNMNENEVVKMLGNPTQIISKIDTTKYIYKDDGNEATIDFNRHMRVITWNRL